MYMYMHVHVFPTIVARQVVYMHIYMYMYMYIHACLCAILGRLIAQITKFTTQRFNLANGKKLCGYSFEINKKEYNLTIVRVHTCTIVQNGIIITFRIRFQYAVIVTEHNNIINYFCLLVLETGF